MWSRGNSHWCCWEHKMVQTSWKTTVKDLHTLWPRASFWEAIPREMRAQVHQETCINNTQCYNSFVPNCPKLEATQVSITEKWINTLWPALKRNEWQLHTMTTMTCVNITNMINDRHHFCHWQYHKPCCTSLVLGMSRKQPGILPNQEVCEAQEFLGLFVQDHGLVLFSANCTNQNMLEC